MISHPREVSVSYLVFQMEIAAVLTFLWKSVRLAWTMLQNWKCDSAAELPAVIDFNCLPCNIHIRNSWNPELDLLPSGMTHARGGTYMSRQQHRAHTCSGHVYTAGTYMWMHVHKKQLQMREAYACARCMRHMHAVSHARRKCMQQRHAEATCMWVTYAYATGM